MNGKQLASMALFIIGFLLLWAAMRMAYVLVRPQAAKISPLAVQAADFVLM